jgi:aspartate kinase
MIEVFKFGGASVKDASGVKNLVEIVKLNRDKKLLIIVSAMGKTTNRLEELTEAYLNQTSDLQEIFSSIKAYHEEILDNLFEDKKHPVFVDIANTFVEIDWIIEEEPHEDRNFIYDQIVSIGELVSTKIVSAYLNASGVFNKWLDARSFIYTDNTYREGQVNWDKTCSTVQSQLPETLSNVIGVTQGFIGGTSENYTTTLGREGSDYTAAIFASCLKADSVTIWKDVPGVLNADPKLFPNTAKYEELSYTEALEMSYYGATVIHPKTIKPLKNAGIPLKVKPFLAAQETGTIVKDIADLVIKTPAIIVKKNQILVSITTKDFSFITENHLSDIFKVFAEEHIRINMLQISAISFSACFDFEEWKFNDLKEAFKEDYNIKYNSNLQLLTVRHFKKELIDELIHEKVVLLEQFSRNTAQLVLKNQ